MPECDKGWLGNESGAGAVSEKRAADRLPKEIPGRMPLAHGR